MLATTGRRGPADPNPHAVPRRVRLRPDHRSGPAGVRCHHRACGGQLRTLTKPPQCARRVAGAEPAWRRVRAPRHAFSEADRLLARPDEAAAAPAIAAADACWRNWRNQAITRHDGWVRADHPIIAQALGQVQSAARIRLMLRDPLGFVWRYALGWRSLVEDEQALSLDDRAY